MLTQQIRPPWFVGSLNSFNAELRAVLTLRMSHNSSWIACLNGWQLPVLGRVDARRA
jgi:hypothetical protein